MNDRSTIRKDYEALDGEYIPGDIGGTFDIYENSCRVVALSSPDDLGKVLRYAESLYTDDARKFNAPTMIHPIPDDAYPTAVIVTERYPGVYIIPLSLAFKTVLETEVSLRSYDKDGFFFGDVVWCDDDIRHALEFDRLPASAKNVSVIKNEVSSTVRGAMIDLGYDILFDTIHKAKEYGWLDLGEEGGDDK